MQEQDKNLLSQAAAEISSLRTQNSIMSAKLEVFESMMLLFTSTPAYRGQGMSEDVVWKIKERLDSENQD